MEPLRLASVSLQQRVPFDTVDEQQCQIHPMTHNCLMSLQQRKGDVLRLSQNIGENKLIISLTLLHFCVG